MITSKTAVTISRIIELVLLAAGIVILFIFGVCTVMSLTDPTLAADGFLGFCFVADVIGGVLIFFSRKRHRLIANFKRYSTILQNNPDGSIDSLAAMVNTAPEKVAENLQKMIKHNYFTNAAIDNSSNSIIFVDRPTVSQAAFVTTSPTDYANPPRNTEKAPLQVEYVAVTCEACGGINRVAKGKVGECEYCGSAVKGE